ncbi:Hpt domain-containing protein [Pseudomonas orientalis]|uniref:Chemotaxis protein CheA n=1 Tax=Pseudomonas orientalis TaxID=76758 RepID=A0A1H2G606_9PSED|nr:Hpt domain-containing protein [Pseudomonas orientalis]KRP65503.1 histidine kinase [Pseudomonas orientalis]SDU15033.1 chemosensory pili system protein ChpA (sensor histidine kinase/response regulator) [Pseudomonas orientalis]
MVDRHDYVALEWVKGDIAETLKQARSALDAYVENGDAIDQCLAGIHQVHGALQMVEFYGAALLAEEIEALALALQAGHVGQRDEGIRLLQQALGQLPLYLDRVHSARRDLPLVVLPLLNDLRSARGESLLSETSLFSPQLLTIAPLPDEALAQRTPPDLHPQLRQWHALLQQALAGLLREDHGPSNLEDMARVFARLEALCQGAPLLPLWQVASALVEGMLTGVIANSPALRSLLKASGKQLKRLLAQGIGGINQAAPDELLKSLLFYVAKVTRPTPRMQSLKERYGLDEALPDSAVVDAERARLAGPDRNAMGSVLGALCEELVRVKERLDLFVRSDRQHTQDLDPLLAPLRQIADTLAVLGFGQPRKVIIDQLAVVLSLVQGQREPSDAVLMDVAGALLYVEATLAGMVGTVEPQSREDSRLPTTDLTQIHQLVIRESCQCLRQAKELVIDCIEADWDRQRLESLPELLSQVRGALAMIPLPRAASLMRGCTVYVDEQLMVNDNAPDEAPLAHFADVISSLEYYLERMLQDPDAAGERVLELATQALSALGYLPVEKPWRQALAAPDNALVSDTAPSQSRFDALASPTSRLNPPALQRPGSLQPPPSDEEPIDDELREVFLEETDEVLHVLHRYLPDCADKTAQSEMRRAFHTLKGSGRMVRALVVAELAWAVENLLNRVLERSVAIGPEVRQVLDEAVALLPELIADFATGRQRQRDEVDALAARAHALASGAQVAVAEPHDPMLLEIFRNEAQSHLDSLNQFLQQAAEHVPLQVTDELQRALHTLKGSAYMAGVLPMAELARPLDHLTREYKAHRLPLDLDEVELLLEAEGVFQRGLRELDSEPLTPIKGAAQLIKRTQSLLDQQLEALLNAPGTGLRIKRDPHLITNFLAQGMDILLDAENLLRRWQQHPGERQELTALLDELTTLGQGAHLADLHAIDQLCEALLDLYGAVEESSLAVSERFFHEAEQAHEALITMLDQLAAGQEISPATARVQALRELLDDALDPSATGLIKRDGSGAPSIAELGAATEQLSRHTALDDEIVDIFLEEAVDILDSAGQSLKRWLLEPDGMAPLSSLQRDLHTLKGGARMAEIDAVGDLAQELECVYEGLVDRRYSYSTELSHMLMASHERLALQLEELHRQQPLSDSDELVARLREWRQNSLPTAPVAAPQPWGADPELLEIFLEEAADILDSSGSALLRWQAEPGNRQEVETLLRDLHTLKGGARMVEIGPIGDLAHELEFLYEGLSAGLLAPSPELFALLQGCHDRLAQMIDAVADGLPVGSVDKLIERIKSLVHPGDEPAVPVALPAGKTDAVVDPAADMVKISAELLDELVNLAGETSIFRGRIEQQVNDARTALTEVETTIERMRDQLRRLDSETQSGLFSRQHAEAERLGYEEFDPLEMDRHSQLQQLSRALSESASDLLDLKETLERRNQDAHDLLQQQARINTQLQEGLMRTRMVPFERMLPRLKRIVRQVAGELGKDVEFVVGNAEGEMDRNVLERMAAPLEHMLRNAVDHGLESREVRLQAGKPEKGRISLDLTHEGGDIVFDMRDDGAGVPLEAVRRKAIKRGLLDPNQAISDRDVLQFILQPGFSTAEKITQISGRGVGMDVVHEEVRQLGGSMVIDSIPGVGVHFRIRLPFTVSVNRALMVQCADDQYAIALNTIEGLVRVLPHELAGHYQQDPPCYEYAGQRYELFYLGDLLHTVSRPRLLGQYQPVPVLLMHCNERQVAVHVDAMAGTREIVVKGLGPQFAGVQGLSGATILGDGRVVLIIDLLAHIRARPPALPAQSVDTPLTLNDPLKKRPLLVLVVDDSVTVRKVTSRLLERNGMNVLTAKDGIDALAVLEEHTPDLMLLDIEMPRMDGFEVAIQIRNDPRLMRLPIIMITSRTGQKHRDRAMAIGVNDYLGKPYQESVLLESIAYWSKPHA